MLPTLLTQVFLGPDAQAEVQGPVSLLDLVLHKAVVARQVVLNGILFKHRRHCGRFQPTSQPLQPNIRDVLSWKQLEISRMVYVYYIQLNFLIPSQGQYTAPLVRSQWLHSWGPSLRNHSALHRSINHGPGNPKQRHAHTDCPEKTECANIYTCRFCQIVCFFFCFNNYATEAL